MDGQRILIVLIVIMALENIFLLWANSAQQRLMKAMEEHLKQNARAMELANQLSENAQKFLKQVEQSIKK